MAQKKKRRKNSPRKKMLNTLDGLIRDIVRLIHRDRCYKCNKAVYGSESHPHHIIAKGNGANWRRFDLRNVILLGHSCHQQWHDNPTETIPWWETTAIYRSVNAYLDRYRGGKSAKITDAEMEDLIVEYKAKRKELQEE